MLNFPELSVVTVRSKALTGLRISTVAFATTAPVGSTTVPVTEVELPPDCASRLKTQDQRKKTIMKAAKGDFL